MRFIRTSICNFKYATLRAAHFHSHSSTFPHCNSKYDFISQAEVQVEVEYTAPDTCDLFLGPEADRASADDTQQSEDDRMSEDGRMSEDEMLLDDVKRNIDRLEKGLAASGQEVQVEQPQQSTSKGFPILPRPQTKLYRWTFAVLFHIIRIFSTFQSTFRSNAMLTWLIFSVNSSRDGERKRISTLKTVKNLMRIGKRRPSNCSSSTDDEGKALVSPQKTSDTPGNENEPKSSDVQSIISFTDQNNTPIRRWVFSLWCLIFVERGKIMASVLVFDPISR